MQRKWLTVSITSSTFTALSPAPMVRVSKISLVWSWVRRLPSMWFEL